jgi:hypothetical protein
MQDLVQGIQQLHHYLLAQQHQGNAIDFHCIRSAMLKSPVINHNHVFRPPVHLDIGLGDIGYFEVQPDTTPKFFKLDNLLDEICLGVYHDPLTVITASPNNWSASETMDGSIRLVTYLALFILQY